MSLMPSNDDLKRQLDATLKGDVASVADRPADQADHSAAELTDNTDFAMSQGFIFFRKTNAQPQKCRPPKSHRRARSM